MKYIILLISLSAIAILNSCGHHNMPGFDFSKFENTEAEQLAIAVENDDSAEVSLIISKNPTIVNYQDPQSGYSLIFLAVVNRKHNALVALLQNGADIRLKSYDDSSDVLMTFCKGYQETECDTFALSWLLRYKPNLKSYRYDSQGNKISLLSKAASSYMCLDVIKMLVSVGVDPNYYPNNEQDDSPLAAALIQDRLDIVDFLLLEKKVSVPQYCLIRQNKIGPDSISFKELLLEKDYSRNPNLEAKKNEILSYIEILTDTL
jgi:ankyrin repeat protein